MAAGRGLNAMVFSELDIFGPNTVNIEVKVPSAKQVSSENAAGMAQALPLPRSTSATVKMLKNIRISSPLTDICLVRKW